MFSHLYDIFKKILGGHAQHEIQEPNALARQEHVRPQLELNPSATAPQHELLQESEELITDPHWTPILPTTEYFVTNSDQASRRIAYTVSGNLDANKVLLCLPGLLETKSSFSVLHAYFLRFSECKVIGIDFSGRGESDALPAHEQYKMSVYLSDISQLLEAKIFMKGDKKVRLTILGTSMGGVLAMYLVQRFRSKIYEIILNDIALTVNWTSLYSLYKSMHNEVGYSEIRDLAHELSVDQRAIAEVQLPTHFDLSYRADIWGMNFQDALENYKGRVGLIYGGASKICTKRRVSEAKAFIRNLNTCEVPGAGHPAPFDLNVCSFIQEEMGVRG
jgi:pimeloyl-ACP methyl ester carboxylesterase